MAKKQIFFGAAITLLIILALAGFKYAQISGAIAEMKKHQPPPAAVTTVETRQETWPVELTSVGELEPVQGTTLAAEELGRVSAIHFESGSAVKKGEVLVELDTSVEEAQLESAKAALQLAEAELKRQQALRSNNANAVSDLEKAEATHRGATALVSQLKATIARKKIVAPFSGKTGVRLVNEGQVIAAGTQVVSLQSFDTLYLNTTFAQRVASKLIPGLTVQFQVDSYPGRTFDGTVTSVEPRIDDKTRNISVQATVPNPRGELRAGMFARVALTLPQTDEVISIPSSSVSFAPFGDTVYVVQQMKDPAGGGDYLGVRQQIVKLGRRRGDLVAVLSGLKAGEQVVSSGAFKLRPGAPVVVNNNVAPGNDPAPVPADS